LDIVSDFVLRNSNFQLLRKKEEKSKPHTLIPLFNESIFITIGDLPPPVSHSPCLPPGYLIGIEIVKRIVLRLFYPLET
jgi:hypothetical protein